MMKKFHDEKRRKSRSRQEINNTSSILFFEKRGEVSLYRLFGCREKITCNQSPSLTCFTMRTRETLDLVVLSSLSYS